VKVKENKK